MAALIPGQFDSTTLIKILCALSDGEITDKSLPYFLRATTSLATRLRLGNRNKKPPTPSWATTSTWLANFQKDKQDDQYEYIVLLASPDEPPEEKNKRFDDFGIRRLRPYFDSEIFKYPTTFNELFAELLTACCQYCQNNQTDAIHAIIEKCLKEEEIDEKFITVLRNMSPGVLMCNQMIGWAIDAAPRSRAKPSSKAAPSAEPVCRDMQIEEFSTLTSKANNYFRKGAAGI